MLQVTVDRAAIGRYGIAARDVLDVVEAIGTRITGQVREGERRFDLAVRLRDEYRQDPARLASIPVRSPGGERVPLGQLTSIREVSGPTTIQREWAKRRLVVQANVRGRDLGGFVDELRDRIGREVALPPGYFVRYGGQFENLERAQRRLMVVVPLALTSSSGSSTSPTAASSTASASSPACRSPWSEVSWPCWREGSPSPSRRRWASSPSPACRSSGTWSWSRASDSSSAAASRWRRPSVRPRCPRMRPVLMTAAVAALGFLPMALNTGVGAEVQRPLATVVIGGVISSTLLTLVVLPVLYAAFGGGRQGLSVMPGRAGAPREEDAHVAP